MLLEIVGGLHINLLEERKISFWIGFLAKKKYLSAPLSLVMSERLFNTIENIYKAIRSRLKPEHCEELAFVHYTY